MIDRQMILTDKHVVTIAFNNSVEAQNFMRAMQLRGFIGFVIGCGIAAPLVKKPIKRTLHFAITAEPSTKGGCPVSLYTENLVAEDPK